MGTAADSGQYGYGIAKDKNRYLASVPLIRGRKQRCFVNIEAARSWQLTLAKAEWGDRWSLIKRGRLSILRKFGCGVSVRRSVSKMQLSNGDVGIYPQFGVFWYDHDGSSKSKFFSYKRFGDDAELEANWFAAQQRAKLTGSRLSLPTHWTAKSFDIRHSVAITNRDKISGE